MGKQAEKKRKETKRTIRSTRLSLEEKQFFRSRACYEGSPYHKRNPGDFGLNPPAAPRGDKTLCDEAGVFEKAIAHRLLDRAIEGGLVSEVTAAGVFPKQIWVVDDRGQVFELMYGGSKTGYYHGYPIRHSDPFFDVVSNKWALLSEDLRPTSSARLEEDPF